MDERSGAVAGSIKWENLREIFNFSHIRVAFGW